ncbi:uncharacterized protein PAC_15489 [Phialocephala subalpina]|uniref:Uncharacterized protein n=1 Tax=Phialocephala subalpina TaxID=576137 RepID=A0A1L7XKL9_9HELO|nr:uncharacterized protein PAC_15489 [Phialocephala subalpina]
MPTAYVDSTLKSFDITNLNATPQGATFMPSSPFTALGSKQPIDPWLASLEDEFDQMLKESPNRSILSPNKRYNMQHHLKHPLSGARGSTKAERKVDGNLRNWTIANFELQDNQIYRKAGLDKKTGTIFKERYAACDSDALDVDKTNHRVQNLFYGITKVDVSFVKKRYNVCKLATTLKPKDLTVKPIIPKSPIYELVVDLMDFTKEPDGNMNWIIQKKNPFTKYIWLSPHEDKEAISTSQNLD